MMKIKKYRIGNGNLQDYTESITIDENTTIYAYTEDELKNIIYAFDKYDKDTKNGEMDFEIGLKKIICML